MNKDLVKFRELLLTDQGFQSKLKDAASAYTGEQTEEAVFNNILVPVAAEYGIAATYEEFKDYIKELSDSEMSKDELIQIAGGKTGGLGIAGCYVIGGGTGAGAGSGSGGVCLLFGVGWGYYNCTGEGEAEY